MSITDPIGDMITRIHNSLLAGHHTVSMPASNMKIAIARILKEEGFIEAFDEASAGDKPTRSLRLKLKYIGERRERRPMITGLRRVSRPGRRVYVGKHEIPWVKSGIGVAILSTPKGVMSGGRARQLGVGGEVLCQIW